MKTPDESRKMFEAWIKKSYAYEDYEFELLQGGEYPTGHLQLAWESWQQSALLAGKDVERLKKLADMTWDVRWSVDPESKDDLVFAIAAEIRSGNFEGIDNKIKEQHERQR